MITPSSLLLAYVTKYARLVQAVMAAHREYTKNLAHDWYHALLTAQYAVVIVTRYKAAFFQNKPPR